MLHVYTPTAVRLLDEACEREAQIPNLQLMENAARSASDIILELFESKQRILVVCGNGNNGGDGFGMARMLSGEHAVAILADPLPANMSDATRRNYERVSQTLELHALDEGPELLRNFDVIIDAMYGVGFHGTLKSSPVYWLGSVEGLYRIAVDVPSGLDALNGSADEFAFNADLTIAMEVLKLGMLCGEGPDLCGEILIAAIGAPRELTERYATAAVIEHEDVRELLPRRALDTSKFDYGRVLVVAGSSGMRGAAALTSSAALVGGAGLVELATPFVHPLVLREVMTTELPSTTTGGISSSAIELLQKRVSKATVVAIGPGVGDELVTTEVLSDFLNDIDESVPIVIDADGLRMLPLLHRNLSNVVLTPHHGEYSHVAGDKVDMDLLTCEERITHIKSVARRLGCVLHVKSYPSITTDGHRVFLSTSGNPGMATAGSGDVLTGLIAAMLSQHVPPFEAAALASYIHGEAGNIAAEEFGEEAMIAGDIIECIGEAIGE